MYNFWVFVERVIAGFSYGVGFMLAYGLYEVIT